MKLHIGSGDRRIAGFLNVDVRPGPNTDVVGHAGDLSQVRDASVDTLFAHALFEHVYVGHQLPVLREWRRVMVPGGLIVCLGLPNFRAICELYLAGAPGIVSPRFDLFEVYRYTHGDPEHAAPKAWPAWSPSEHRDAAPSGWIPQLHKGLFDPTQLADLLARAGLDATVFAYTYPGERHRLNLGFVSQSGSGPAATRLGDDEVVRLVARVPDADRYVQTGSVRSMPAAAGAADGLAAYADQLDTRHPHEPTPTVAPSLAARVRRKFGRLVGGS
ncbi:MAG TPA: methyltransferase domain-containing protein [Humisphaera sp.]